ncbi:MAG: PAS domain S-box protein, partial [Bacteroidota bacterium]
MTSSNRAATRLLGYSDAQWKNVFLQDFIVGWKAGFLKRRFFEATIHRRAGQAVRVKVYVSDAVHQRKRYHLLTLHELSPRPKSPFDLSLREFKEAITSSSIISMADRSGVITYVNDNFTDISGYSKSELLGQNHRIINSGYHPRSFWIDMWQTISSGKTWRSQVKNRRKDGTYYWVDTFIMPLLNEQGRVREFLSIRNDITTRKQAEESLQQVNERLSDTLNFARMGSAELNLKTQILTISPEMLRLLDVLSEIPMVMTIQNFVDTYVVPEDRNIIYEKIKEGMGDGSVSKSEVSAEFNARTAGGRLISLEARGIFRDSIAFGILHDITDRKKSEIESAAKSNQITNILSSISDGFFALDKNWNFIFANPVFEKMSGVSTGSLNSKNIWQTFPMLVESPVYTYYHEAVTTGKTQHFEWKGNNTAIIYDVHTYPHADGLLVYFRDISSQKKSQEEIQKLALIASRTKNAVILTDKNGNIHWINEGFERISGYNLLDVSGKAFWNVSLGPESNPDTVALIRKSFINQKDCRTEILKYSKTGRHYWMDVEIMPLKDDEGHISGFMVFELDITAIKTAIGEMLKSQEQLKTIVDNVPMDVFIKDLCGRYTFYNKSFEKHFNGKRNLSTVTDDDLFNKADADSFRATDQSIIQNRETLTLEQDIVSNDTIETYYTIKFPLYDLEEDVYAIAGVSLPITDRKRTEKALERSEYEMRAVLDASSDAIFLLDRDCKILLFNSAAERSVMQATRNGITRGDSMLKFVSERELDYFNNSFAKAINGQTVEYDWEVVTENKSAWYHLRYIPVFNKNADILGVSLNATDITQRKLAEEESERSRRLFESLVRSQTNYLIRTDINGNFTFANVMFLKKFGYLDQGINGKPYEQTIAPEDHDKFRFALIECVTFIGKIVQVTLRNLASNGVFHWTDWEFTTIKSDEGLVEIQAIGHDISRRKKLEAEQARLDKIVRESYNEIYLFHADTLQFEFANTSALNNLQYTLPEVGQMKITDLFSYPDEMAIKILLNHVRKGETDRLQLQLKFKRKDTTQYNADVLIQSLEKERFVAIVTDITTKLITEQKLLDTILEKEMLIKEIHHRVKNNLQLISSIIYLKMSALGQSDIKTFLENTRQKIRSIALIHERLLQSEKLDKVEISDYLGKLVSDLQTTNCRQDLELKVETDFQKTILSLDTAIFCGLIVNELVTNAI